MSAHNQQISPSFMRCEPGEGKHVFERHGTYCDCWKRRWPNNASTFTIPAGETWIVLPLPTTA